MFSTSAENENNESKWAYRHPQKCSKGTMHGMLGQRIPKVSNFEHEQNRGLFTRIRYPPFC